MDKDTPGPWVPHPLPKTVRLAALLPAPFSLSDYEPFAPIGTGTFGFAEVKDVSPLSVTDLAAGFGRAFRAGATVGYSFVPRVKAVFFDMDATVIVEESLVELARVAGKAEEVAKITERAMAGELDFREALKKRVATLKGLPESVFAEVSERLTLNRGIQPFTAFCREIRIPCFMVSGGFVQLAEPIQRKVGFNAIKACTLEVEGGKLTGKVTGEIIDADAKLKFLNETCASLGISPREACAVGDGANDAKMLSAAGVAVGHKAKPILYPHLHALNATGNHGFLGPLLFGRDLTIIRSKVAQ